MSTVHTVLMPRKPVIKNESCMCMIEDVLSFSLISNFSLNNWPYLCGGDKNKLTKGKKYGNLNNSSITCISNVNFLIL